MYVFVRAHFPLCVSMISGDVDDDDVREMEGAIDWMKRQASPYVTLSITHDITRVDTALRRRMSGLAARHSCADCKAAAVVVDSDVVAGALRAVRWVAPSAHPERGFKNVAVALAWLFEQGRKSGVTLTPAAQAMAMGLDRQLRESRAQAAAP